MTDERFIWIVQEITRCEADTDYYVGGLISAGIARELSCEVMRLREKLAAELEVRGRNDP